MKIHDLALCSSCRRVVAVRAGRLAEHAKRPFAWNSCPGSGRAPA